MLESEEHWLNISQHGESKFNLDGKIGGDADLSERGELYALKLPGLLRESIGVRLISIASLTQLTDISRMIVRSLFGPPP